MKIGSRVTGEIDLLIQIEASDTKHKAGKKKLKGSLCA